jgi:hypothetical protein
MSKQNRETLIRWYRVRIQDLTNRIEEAFMEDLALGYIEELEEARSRFEELLEELLNEGDVNEKTDEP